MVSEKTTIRIRSKPFSAFLSSKVVTLGDVVSGMYSCTLMALTFITAATKLPNVSMRAPERSTRYVVWLEMASSEFAFRALRSVAEIWTVIVSELAVS